MKYCSKLFHDINFEPSALSPCCNTENTKVPAFLYSGGEIDMEAYASHVMESFAKMQTGALCGRCGSLTETDSEPEFTGKFNSVSLNMHRFYCNCKCRYCDFWRHPEKGKGYDPLPGIKSLGNAGALATGCFFSWGGGESSILPNFEEASKWILDQGFRQHIHTNALKHSPAISAVLSAGNGYVTASLDSGNPETYKKVKGINGFGLVMENLGKYAAVSPNGLILKYIVHEANNSKSDIDDFFEAASRLGVVNIEFSLNFIELNKNIVSDKTLFAAAYFIAMANSRKLKLSPFFIPAKWKRKIFSILESLTGQKVNARL